jgi:hypothetical protein
VKARSEGADVVAYCAGRVLRATWYKRISFTFVPEATTVQSVYGEGVRPWTRPSNSCAE